MPTADRFPSFPDVCTRSFECPDFRYWHQTDMPVQSPHVRCRGMNGPSSYAPRGRLMVESRCGAVALGRTYLLPPLSSGRACDALSEGFSYFVTSIAAPVASGWSVCRV